MNKFILVIIIFIINGCTPLIDRALDGGASIPYTSEPYTEDLETLYLKGHVEMCHKNKDDMFCENQPSIGDIQWMKWEVSQLVTRMAYNTRYEFDEEDVWFHNESVHMILRGDCEDIAMTMIHHMVNEGVDKKHLVLVAQILSETSAHMFVAVKTQANGWVRVDALEKPTTLPLNDDDVSFHMLMTDVGVHRWHKGAFQR